jgi:RNA polymerase sigma-70 factor (ECF subfamily)
VEPTRTQTFEQMFRDHYAAVRGYALRRTSPEAAQDAAAETFLVAWRRFEQVPDDARPWLLGVARRVLANERRSTKRGAALAQRVALTEVDTRSLGEAADETDAVRQALGRLSERDREALTLVAWHGLSGARAARAAGCSRSAFAVRLHRARRRLAAELGRDPAPDTPNPKSLEVT